MKILVTIISFTLLDALWLGVIAKRLYAEHLNTLLRLVDGKLQPLWVPAIGVYVALIIGIVCFVLPKAQGHLGAAFLWGALFGFVTYATYDLTNLAVLAHWSVKITVIDIVWGMFLCGITSLLATWI